jgi:hypothetical protein
VYETIDPVLDRVAKMDFDPDSVVLLDKQVAYDQREMADADPTVWAREKSRALSRRESGVEFLPPLKNEVDRPEIVRLRVPGGGGYLVLADTYFPGWSARVTDSRGVGTEVPILPANGVMRAIPLPPSATAVTVEMRYRPWPWRIGAAVSLGAASLFLILIGLTLIQGRNRAPAGETWPN